MTMRRVRSSPVTRSPLPKRFRIALLVAGTSRIDTKTAAAPMKLGPSASVRAAPQIAIGAMTPSQPSTASWRCDFMITRRSDMSPPPAAA
jgi:hypothetical protein